MKAKALLIVLLITPALSQAQSNCDQYQDAELSAIFQEEKLTDKTLKAGYILSRIDPKVYHCTLTDNQKDQVCNYLLQDAGIARDQMYSDPDLASRVKNAFPFIYHCTMGWSAYSKTLFSFNDA